MKHLAHQIRVQRVEVAFEMPDSAFKVRNELSEMCRQRLVPAMEKLMDSKYRGGDFLSLGHLLIDIGRIPRENWEKTFVKKVTGQLERLLDEQYEERVASQFSPEDIASSRDTDRRAGFMLYYLKHGLLPWNSPHQDKQALKNELQRLLKPLGQTPGPVSAPDPANARAFSPVRSGEFAEKLRKLLGANANMLRRFLYLLPEKYLQPVLFRKEWDRGVIRKVRKSWASIFQLGGLPRAAYDIVFLQSLAVLHDGFKGNGLNDFSAALSRELFQILKQQHKQAYLKLQELPEKYFNQIPYVSRPASWKTAGDALAPENFPFPERPPFSGDVQFPGEAVRYINNAGLVLLHPFLASLFEHAGHTLKNKWDSVELQQRSLILSQYLVSGVNDYTEQDVFLNKILTGFLPEEPLPLDVELSDFERREADELLESVIQHWNALKNTTTGGLRETFLQRTGRMEKKENAWLLQVDQRTPDILLNKIPWGFSTIKTTWMKEILNVEWA